MFNIIKDFKWYKIKINWIKLFGRCYYLNQALIWWIVDVIVFVSCGISLTLLYVSIPLGIITFISTSNWIRTLIYSTLVKATELKLDDILDRGTALEGIPGAGKSSSINSFGYLLARKQWRQLTHDYWQVMHLPYEKLSNNLKNKYAEIIESYRYYFKYIDTHIPCLHSIYPIFDGLGRKSHDLSKEHLSQKKRLPYRSVWICDEISSMFPNDLLKKEPGTVSNLKYQWRWIRHFTDSYAICADIRFGDAFLAIRSASGYVLTLTKKQKWVLKPRLLCSIKAFWDTCIDFNFWFYLMTKPGSRSNYKYERNLFVSSKHQSWLYCWLVKLINCIGYRKYSYIRSGTKVNYLSESDVDSTSGTYYLKSCLDISYNDRVFKNLYKPINDDFDEPSFNNDWFLSTDELKKRTGIK